MKILLGKPEDETIDLEFDTVDLGPPDIMTRYDGVRIEVPNADYKFLVAKGIRARTVREQASESWVQIY